MNRSTSRGGRIAVASATTALALTLPLGGAASAASAAKSAAALPAGPGGFSRAMPSASKPEGPIE
ncbi:hypothetical protein ACWF94_01900, partial [Streptomyces sp. NPDC055078]